MGAGGAGTSPLAYSRSASFTFSTVGTPSMYYLQLWNWQSHLPAAPESPFEGYIKAATINLQTALNLSRLLAQPPETL
jgi:hypothetical protein